MAFTWTYAASGKNAGTAPVASPVTIACHNRFMRATNAGSVPDGRARVCGRVPGSTVVLVVVAGGGDVVVVVGTGLDVEAAAGGAPWWDADEQPASTNAITTSRRTRAG